MVQQKRGLVRLTIAVGGERANNDLSLEREADTMGARAARLSGAPPREVLSARAVEQSAPVVQGLRSFDEVDCIDA